MECSRCQTSNRPDAKFCNQCGTSLASACPDCGTELPPDAQFCNACGRPVTGPQPVATPARLQQYIPPELLAKLESARTGGSMQGERRVVTMLFCDVAGSTAASGPLDPEDWAEIMNCAFQHLITPVYRHEGTLARLMGDAVLGFFGPPIAHEDDPQRAVLAGLEIIRGIRPYSAQVRDNWGLDFNVRVGINTGLVVVEEVGSDLRVEYTALGDAVNLAARMEQIAEPGTVQITEDTHKLIAPLFEFEDLGGLRVKGKDEPVPAYRVLRQKAQPGRLRGLDAKGIGSPLVGRSAELEAVNGRVERLSNGQGGVVFVIGEAGLGKSRMMDEVRRHSGETNGRTPSQWLQGHTLSFGQKISYWPFQDILRQKAGITENDSETETWHKLESSVSALFGERSAEVLPYLASLLSLARIHRRTA